MKNFPSTCGYRMNYEVSKLFWKLLGIECGRVLDAGSGQGGFGLAKPNEVSLIGVELDPKAASASVGYDQIFIESLEDELETTVFIDGNYDGILCRDVLEHFDYPWLITRKFYKSLKVGGVLLVSVPKPRPSIVWSDYTHRRGFTTGALNDLLTEAGFEVEKISSLSGFSFASKFGLVRYLPFFSKIPLVGWHMVNYVAIARKKTNIHE